MKADELSFANQQLAGMLRAGLPLEGALRQLCREMRSGKLRVEFTRLEEDLSQGTPLRQALEKRALPDFYRTLLGVGQAGGDLPGTLLLVADHYERVHTLKVRLKTLMVYPFIILLTSLGVSLLLAWIFGPGSHLLTETHRNLMPGEATPTIVRWGPWFTLFAPLVFGLLLAGMFLCLSVGPLRAWLLWQVPGFRDASLSRVAEMFALLLSRNYPLPQVLELMRRLEKGRPLDRELEGWEKELASGTHRIEKVAQNGHLFPPLFLWLVATGGEDWAAGFQRAAAVYHGRAQQRIEMGLHAFLPVATFFLGALVLVQMYPVILGMLAGLTDAMGM